MQSKTDSFLIPFLMLPMLYFLSTPYSSVFIGEMNDSLAGEMRPIAWNIYLCCSVVAIGLYFIVSAFVFRKIKPITSCILIGYSILAFLLLKFVENEEIRRWCGAFFFSAKAWMAFDLYRTTKNIYWQPILVYDGFGVIEYFVCRIGLTFEKIGAVTLPKATYPNQSLIERFFGAEMNYLPILACILGFGFLSLIYSKTKDWRNILFPMSFVCIWLFSAFVLGTR